ncbi:MAG TPA: DEAD/DEAH box helicase [Candidatus Pacearchaeota archaeon]|nr:DEAD/DEAH box helicase [Candidatus Pacearchaeota archaeon]HPR79927.1 DEAD/DEAH box helicase [Candidatus Pacearchaeota archaeon]
MQKRRFNSNNRKFGDRSRFRKEGFSQKKRGFSATRIDISKFIQKVMPAEEDIAYKPENKFIDFEIDNRLKSSIVRKGYSDPTPIQDKIIPLILKGRDVVGIANTGTGKTAAFLIPAINKTLLNRRNKTIIIVPTRELAFQIEKEFREFTIGMHLFSMLCIGGTSVRDQLRKAKMNNDFIIGTPGRIKDLVQRKALNMATFQTIVLDEADRMLDMGFVEDMRFLMAQMPEQKQSLLFSATIPDEIEKLSRQFLRNPEKVSVKTKESSTNVNQDIVKVGDPAKKLDVLCDLLGKKEFTRVLVFGKTKHGVEKLSKSLVQRGFKAESIHGDKNQSKRKRAVDFFKTGIVKILVATDVAARGLDIDNVSHVINYDIPATYDDYVHRIGRTGRGKRKGEALTFI